MTESSPARADIADLPPAHSALPAWVFSLLTAGLIIAATWVIGGMALRQAGLIESVRLDRRVTQAGPSEAYVGPLHLSLPADALRYQSSEREGPSARVDLAVQWPDLSGIDPTTPDAPLDRVIFLTLSVSDVERDMSERLDSVYRRLFTGQGTVTPDGLVVRPLNPDAGYG